MPIHQLRNAFNSARRKLKWRFNKSKLQRSFIHSTTSQEELAARPNYSRTPYSASDRAGECASNTVSQDPPFKEDTNRASSGLDIPEGRPGLRASIYYEANVDDFILYAEQGVSLIEAIRDVVPDDSSIHIGEDEAREMEHGRCCRCERDRHGIGARILRAFTKIFSKKSSASKWVDSQPPHITANEQVDQDDTDVHDRSSDRQPVRVYIEGICEDISLTSDAAKALYDKQLSDVAGSYRLEFDCAIRSGQRVKVVDAHPLHGTDLTNQGNT